jgi:uncharacterized protein
MPRPIKCRRVNHSPEYLVFKPAGIPARQLKEVELTLDEFEAIRLADLKGLYHEEAAQKMDISRQTFGNILASARKKIADMLVHGKALSLQGGNISLTTERLFACRDCNTPWFEPFGTGHPRRCPTCECENISRIE